MEDGVKEEPARTKEPKFLGKAGWIKKSTSRFLGSYKDRYIQVEKTEIVVYEDEELQTCLERVNLENYDKCLELRSTFLKKHRLVLIQTPKSGNKVQDVKFQVPNPEEKEAWIKVLRDGISRAKNKVFDEVKIDETNHLDHVTRTRPKGNRNRRPPTRIHMKEVANTSSDNNLRLDLDVVDKSTPNGFDSETLAEAIKTPMPPPETSEGITEEKTRDSTDEGPQIQAEPSPKKKILKPPMPPSKEVKPIDLPEEEIFSPEKKVLKPPMPSSNVAKPSVVDGTETLEDEESPETKLSPPNKPISSSTDDGTNDALSTLGLKPPTPPSRDKKPPQPTVEHSQEDTPSYLDDATEVEEEKEMVLGGPAIPVVKDQLEITVMPVCIATEGEVLMVSNEVNDSAPNNEKVTFSHLLSATSTVPTSELIQTSSGQTVLPKKKPVKLPPSKTMAHVEPNTQPRDESKCTITQRENTPNSFASPPTTTVTVCDPLQEVVQQVDSKSDLPVVISLNVSDNVSGLGIMERKEREEEKSVDSGQHSDDDDELPEGRDMLMASTSALHGSHVGLDLLDVSEEEAGSPDCPRQVTDEKPPCPTGSQSNMQSHISVQKSSGRLHSALFERDGKQTGRPTIPIKPSAMTRSASVGDVLSEPSGHHKRSQSPVDNVHDDMLNVSSPVLVLQSQVSLELEKTVELLDTMAKSKAVDSGENTSEQLLVRVLEKLKMADQFLREATNVKESKLLENSSRRKSF